MIAAGRQPILLLSKRSFWLITHAPRLLTANNALAHVSFTLDLIHCLASVSPLFFHRGSSFKRLADLHVDIRLVHLLILKIRDGNVIFLQKWIKYGVRKRSYILYILKKKRRNENFKFYLEMTIMASVYANVRIFYLQKIKSTSFHFLCFFFCSLEKKFETAEILDFLRYL